MCRTNERGAFVDLYVGKLQTETRIPKIMYDRVNPIIVVTPCLSLCLSFTHQHKNDAEITQDV